MKNYLWVLIVIFAGCSQESEVDKCVTAQAVQACNSSSIRQEKVKELWQVSGYKSVEECIADLQKVNGADWRLECLRAQAGK